MASHAEALLQHVSVPTPAASSASISLAPRGARTIVVGKAAVTIRCLRGSVWITQEGDRRDHVVYPGEQVTTSGAGNVVVYGFEASEVLVSSAGATR